MKKYAKIFALMMSLVLVIGVLSACSLMGPRSAKDCFEKSLSNTPESFHMDFDMDLDMAMGFDDPTMSSQLEEALGTKTISIPITFSMQADVNKNKAHADMDMRVSMLGQKEKVTGEMYVDGEEGYSYTCEDGGEWYKNELDDKQAFSQFFGSDDLEDIDWDKAEFKKTDNGYTVTFAAEDIGELVAKSAADYMNASEFDAFEDFEFTDGNVVFTFDKKCQMTKVAVDGLVLEGSSEIVSDLGSMNTTVTVDGTCEYSDFGKIDSEKCEVPKKVKKNAIEGDSGFGTEDILGGGGDSVEPTTPSEPDNSGGSASGSGTVLNGADTLASPYCFTVGQDIAPGTYKVYRTSKSGSGVLSVSDAETFETNYNLNMGYGLDTDDPDGTTVVLDTGDQIYMTDDLILEFR